MKQIKFAIFSILISASIFANADAVPGKPAPAFQVKDSKGEMQSLAGLKGKWIVLEWFNKDCPYVKKHYSVGNMQKIQKAYAEKATWLTVISSAKGKQGHLNPAEAVKVATENKSAAKAILLDEEGVMGRAYGAKTTPQMFIINPEGIVVYAGAIDDNDSANSNVIPKSKNFVMTALDSALAGKPIETATTRPYGCSVKYN